VIAFMGIGLVDPILPVLAQDLDATASQVSLLFTFATTGTSMLVTGLVSGRIGPRRMLLAGRRSFVEEPAEVEVSASASVPVAAIAVWPPLPGRNPHPEGERGGPMDSSCDPKWSVT
jgi:ACDE family multidrug resistance protein